MNKYFNFKKPDFHAEYGEDWFFFDSVVEDNVDYSYSKTEQLYWLADITRTPSLAVDLLFRKLGLSRRTGETLSSKKNRIRHFKTETRNKPLQTFYNTAIKGITGTDSVFYGVGENGTTIWGNMTWPVSGSVVSSERVWSGGMADFSIFIDVKTTDSTTLDSIVEVLEERIYLPAFYKIYLIDSTFTILRTVG